MLSIVTISETLLQRTRVADGRILLDRVLSALLFVAAGIRVASDSAMVFSGLGSSAARDEYDHALFR